jgi:RNA polymerase sigma-70 factor (ECF subfamily)
MPGNIFNCGLNRPDACNTMNDHRTDADLLERLKESDEEAFHMLFERYQPIVFRQVMYKLRDTDLSHDIVQETFIRVWEKRVSLKPHLGFLALLLRISGNLVRDAARRRQTRERLAHAVPPPALSEGDDPEEALQLSMLQDRLSSVINEDLPEKCRAIFLLSRVEGKSIQEIANLLAISEKTVENQINRALKVLRKRLRTR